MGYHQSLVYAEKKTKLRGRSPQANCTDRATAACRRSHQPLRVEGVAWSPERIPTAVNLGLLEPVPLLFHSSSSSSVLVYTDGDHLLGDNIDTIKTHTICN
jgi:hypothetical protein